MRTVFSSSSSARRASARPVRALRFVVATTLAAALGFSVLAVNPAAAQDPTAQPPPPAPEPLFRIDGPELGVGDGGAEVAYLQMRLSERGFFIKDNFGSYGEGTRHAVVAYQKYYELPRTGRVDAWTRISLAVFQDKAPPVHYNWGRAVEVDLRRQIMIVSTGGFTDYVFDISSGKSSTPTPRGSFRIGREINGLRRSSLGTLWRPKYFKGGYALHGSPSVPAHPASHGCIRMTDDEVNFLWDAGLAPVGTPVVVY